MRDEGRKTLLTHPSSLIPFERKIVTATKKTGPASAEQVKQAKEKLDAHVREIVRWHFSPDTGTPFWLEKAKGYKFNPHTDVKCFEDLKLFGHFEDEWLRGG